jgi:hypothetical protein
MTLNTIKYLSLVIFLLSGFTESTNKECNTLRSFNEISENPYVIKYKNSKEINNRGGHLQGVQLIKSNNSEYAVLSGSSDSYSYYSVIKLGTRNEVISVNKLMDKPFKHAGGFQIFQNYMAVGIEDNSRKDRSKVCIYNIEDPENPPVKPIAVIEREGEVLRSTAGCVGITKYNDKAIIAVGDWDTEHIDFYSCNYNKLKGKNIQFDKICTIDTKTVSKKGWINKKWLSYQNINLFTDNNNNLFLIGLGQNRKKQDIADLFSLDLSISGSCKLTKIASKCFACKEGVSFRAGAGLKFTDNGKLMIISCGSHIRSNSHINYFKNSNN